VTRNTHTIVVKSDSADLTMTIQNIPSEENPRTGKITALSTLAALRRLTAPLVVGT
jgi:aspartate dehydrogenase